MRKIFLFFFILFVISSLRAQTIIPPSPIKWYTMKQALELNKNRPRPIFIDFYTDWCGFCTQMMNTTFTDPTVSAYINNNYYAVRFDAEGADTVVYKDTTYIRRKDQKTNDFAIHMLNQQLMYPTFVIITKQGNRINIPGFQETVKFIPILIFFAEEIYTSDNYENFEKSFYKVYPPNSKAGYTVVHSKVKWMNLEDALKANETKPRKLFIDFNVNWSNACTIMFMNTYTDSIVADLLNKYFYPVRIDATTKDTLNFGAPYVNDGKLNGFHQLPVAMLQGKMKFPATLYLDENSKLVNVMNEYLPAELMSSILSFYGLNAYKTQKWPDYYKAFIEKKEREKKLQEEKLAKEKKLLEGKK